LGDNDAGAGAPRRQEGHPGVSDLLNDKTPIRARHIRPGQGQAVEVKAGQFLQIQTVQGKQVADFVAFAQGDKDEYLSTSATRATNANIIPQLGMTLYSNRRQPMFEIIEDTVGRHDMLYACCDPVRYEMLGAAPGHTSCRAALTDALNGFGIGYDRIPSPINWFMNVSILQRGELEIREPLAEAGDYVLLRALTDVIAAVSACPQDLGPTNAFNPTELVIRVYRDEPLPPAPVMANGLAAAEHGTEGEPSSGDGADQPAEDVSRRARRAARREAKREEATVGVANIEAAAPPAAAEIQPAAPTNSRGAVQPTSRPARLRDTAECTVTRVESADTASG
jgi:uncharacterized protein YcgI (DUF1989 family)